MPSLRLTFLCLLYCSAVSALPKIDMMMRTWERATPLILMFLRSFEIFFPMELLGNMFLILDKSKQNRITASVMPAYVSVVYEEPFDINVNFIHPHDSGRLDNGRLISQVSNFFSDKYGNSEVIGFVDSDVIFRAPAMSHVLFRDGKPKLFCSQHRDNLGMDSARHIDSALHQIYPFSCMENFPFLMWRSSFPRMRNWLKAKLHNSNVEEALLNLVHQKQYINFFGNFAILGSYLYMYERDKYHVVVGGNGPHSTCPEFRAGMHVHYSIPNFRAYPHKLSWDYFRTASEAIYSSLRLCSNKTSVEDKIRSIHRFLSLEEEQEYMFGRPGHLVKKGCYEYLDNETKTYMSHLSIWCNSF